jgi:hypothetical protein
MKIEIKYFIIYALLLVASLDVNAQQKKGKNQPTTDINQEVKFPSASQFANSKISYKIIPAAEKTFGYDILADGKLMIHQPTIPGMPGNKGFKSEAAAQKIATLVIGKIKNGEMPPTVSVEEVKAVE